MSNFNTVAIYIRVSTDIQAEQGYSVQTQIDECTNKAKSLGATNIIEYVDDFTGTKLDRPALNKLRERIRTKDIDAVICYDPDRLARNLAHQLIISDEIEKYCPGGLIFVSVDFKHSAEGRLFFSMRGAFAEYEREKILERLIRGRKGKLKAGKIGNHHLYGYIYDKKKQTYIINEDEAKIIKNIFTWYTEGLNIISILHKLTADNIPKIYRNKNHGWTHQTIINILNNENYAGIYHGWSKKVVANKVSLKPRHEWIDIAIPAIITKDVYAKTKLMLNKNKSKAKRNTKNIYLLQGISYCSSCKSKLYVTDKYYICSQKFKLYQEKNRYNEPIKQIKCKASCIPTLKLDNIVWDILSKICYSKDTIKKYLEETNQATNIDDTNNRLELINKEINNFTNKQKNILEWYANGLIEDTIAEKKLNNIKKLLAELYINRKSLLMYKNQISQNTVDDIYNIFNNNAKITIEDKRNIVKSILDKVYVQRKIIGSKKSAPIDINFYFVFK